MEEIARQPQLRILCDKAVAGFSDVKNRVSRFGAKRIAIVLCTLTAITVSGSIFMNLKHVKIMDAGKSIDISTFSTSVPEILKQNNIKYSPYDKITFSGLKNNYGTIKIIPAFKVTVAADQKTYGVMIAEGTVKDVLKKAGVSLGADDLISKGLGQKIAKGDEIVIQRVTYQKQTTYKPIPFSTKTKTSTLLVKGQQRVLENGSLGKEAIISKVKFIDGKSTEQTTVDTSVCENPTDRVVLMGTAASTPVSSFSGPSDLTLDGNGRPVNYSHCFTGTATGYSSDSGAATSSGRTAGVGYVAVNPNLIPYGSKLYIMSPDGSFVYGSAVAADTGGFVTNGSGVLTDLYFNSDAQCRSFGARTVKIYVVG